jgi:hypothetical protein
MSFSLTVWYAPQPLSKETAAEIDHELREDRIEVVPVHENIDAFYKDLIARYPEIDTIPEDRVDDKDYCPSGALSKTHRHVSMSCVFSQAQNVIRFVYKLTCLHGLVLYDPQSETLYPPKPPNAKKKK